MFENNEAVDLFAGAEYFFDAIKAKCSTDKECAAEILKARGFLLEDDKLALSDNSHSDDAAYLNELLTETNLGKVSGNEISIFPNAKVEKIFYSKNISGCGGSINNYLETLEKFVHDSFAPKVKLRLLEPFVGRYVKAINACGVATFMSCDGNHQDKNKILIEFKEVSSLWHEIICKRLLAGRFKLKWDNRYSAIKFDKNNKWQTYLKLNRAAEFLYNNRIKLRQIRREAANGISNSMTRHLSSEELANIFSERANKLFDELTL